MIDFMSYVGVLNNYKDENIDTPVAMSVRRRVPYLLVRFKSNL